MGVALIFMMAIVLPGNYSQTAEEPWFGSDVWTVKYGPRYQHGWPLRFADRYPDLDDNYERLPATFIECWRFWSIQREDVFNSIAFSIDIVATCLIAGLWGFLFEAWRRRRRNLWQFHLSDVLVLLTIAGVLLSIFSSAKRSRDREETELAAEFEKSFKTGPRIVSRYSEFGFTFRRSGPTWLRLLFGDSFFRVFDRVVSLDHSWGENASRMSAFTELEHVGLASPTPEEMKNLEGLRNLRSLEAALQVLPGYEVRQPFRKSYPPYPLPYLPKLRELNLNGSWLRPSGLSQMKALEMLDLRLCPITEETIEELRDMPRLRSLNLDQVALSKPILEKVGSLKGLEQLKLSQTNVDDDSIAQLVRLTSLRKLSLARTKITYFAAAHLAEMKTIEVLDLAITQIDERAVKELVVLPELSDLDLYGTAVGDRAFDDLAKMRKLRRLRLSPKMFSRSTILRLQNALPNTNIECDFPDFY